MKDRVKLKQFTFFCIFGLFSFDGELDADPFKDNLLELADEDGEVRTVSLSTKQF